MTLEATFESGKVLALYHKLLQDFQSEWTPTGGSYHAAPSVETGLKSIPNTLGATGDREVESLIRYLRESYRTGAKTAEACGLGSWPQQIVHADWPPGNMLFRG